MGADVCQLVCSPCWSAAGGSVGDAGRFLLLPLECAWVVALPGTESAFLRGPGGFLLFGITLVAGFAFASPESNFTQSSWRFARARSSGDMPAMSRTDLSAPARRSSRTHSVSPRAQASCRGCQPYASVAASCAFADRRATRHCSRPLAAAPCLRVIVAVGINELNSESSAL